MDVDPRIHEFHRKDVRRRVFAVVALAAWGACQPVGTTTPPHAATSSLPPAEADPSDDVPDPESQDAVSDGASRCRAPGVPWTGKLGSCLYEHGGCCYPDPATLCARAGCAPDRCQVIETTPAQVVCRSSSDNGPGRRGATPAGPAGSDR